MRAMKKPDNLQTPNLQNLANEQVQKLLQKFIELIDDIESDEESDEARQINIKQIDMMAKSGQSLVKLIDMFENWQDKKNRQSRENLESEHTPYDQIPPPSEAEMQTIDARLDDIFNRLRSAAIADGLYAGIDPEREDISTAQLEEITAKLSKMPRN